MSITRRPSLASLLPCLAAVGLLSAWTPGPATAAPDAASDAPAKRSGVAWLHVRVAEAGEETAKLNVPVAALEALLAVAKVDSQVHATIDHHDVDVSDLRELWKELRAAGGGDLVAAESRDQSVHVGLDGESVAVVVREKGGAELTRARVPASVMDALLGTSGDSVDLLGAVRAFVGAGGGELLTARSGDQDVRIWID